MREYRYLDIRSEQFGGIEVLFPGWQPGDERLCVYSPHDDDAILGAGYAMRAAMDAGDLETVRKLVPDATYECVRELLEKKAGAQDE